MDPASATEVLSHSERRIGWSFGRCQLSTPVVAFLLRSESLDCGIAAPGRGNSVQVEAADKDEVVPVFGGRSCVHSPDKGGGTLYEAGETGVRCRRT